MFLSCRYTFPVGSIANITIFTWDLEKSAINHQLNVQFTIRMIFAWQSEIAIASDWQNTKTKAQVALDGSRPKFLDIYLDCYILLRL